MQWLMNTKTWTAEVGPFTAKITKRGKGEQKFAVLFLAGQALGTLDLSFPGRTCLDIQVWAVDLIESALTEAHTALHTPHD